MDDPLIAEGDLSDALRDIATLNRWTLAGPMLWRRIAPLVDFNRRGSFTVLDVACGSADVSLHLLENLRRHGLDARLSACDLSPVAVSQAEECARRRGVEDARFFVADAVRDDLGGPYDLVMSSLFLHHLPSEAGTQLLRRLASASRDLVVVGDLRRSRRGRLLARAGSRLLVRSPVVRFDAVASVDSAHTLEELEHLAEAAGLGDATIHRIWPQRMVLLWRRSSEPGHAVKESA
jgi:SAM-dependent methyltransferase